LSLEASQEGSVVAVPHAWTWAAQPLRVQDAAGLPTYASWLAFNPVAGPSAWVLGYWVNNPQSGPDADQVWHPALPVGVPLRLTMPLENRCGPQPWGSTDLTATDPAPAAPFLLRLDQAVTFYACPPTAPKASLDPKAGAIPPAFRIRKGAPGVPVNAR
jgi:hypothetical protein